MNSKIKTLSTILVVTGVAVGGLIYIYKAPNKPPMLQYVEDRLKSIIIPKAPIGTLTPTRDLKGVWKSSLANKGVQLFGRFEFGDAVTAIHEEGDMELIIESVDNNIASGTMRFTNLCVNSLTTAPNITPMSLENCAPDSGYLPVSIVVSASSLDFGTQVVDGATITMSGTYTTDIMTGAMSAVVPDAGEIKGRFYLFRQK